MSGGKDIVACSRVAMPYPDQTNHAVPRSPKEPLQSVSHWKRSGKRGWTSGSNLPIVIVVMTQDVARLVIKTDLERMEVQATEEGGERKTDPSLHWSNDGRGQRHLLPEVQEQDD